MSSPAQTPGAEAPKKITVLQEVEQGIQVMAPQFRACLPPHITVERFIRIASTAVQINPQLVNQCTRKSLYLAFLQAAQDGLLPDGREGAVLPYGDVAHWSPMIQGICKKARQSGQIKTLDAQVVCENDVFEYWTDETGPHFKHVPVFKDRGADKLTYAYAVTDDGFFFEVITEDEMAQIEGMSKGKNTPWKGPFRGEMKRKSALRRLAKYRLPSSTDLEELVRRDDDLYVLPAEDPKKDPPTGSGPNRLKSMIKDKEKPQEAEIVAAGAAPPPPAAAPGATDEEIMATWPMDLHLALEAKGMANVADKAVWATTHVWNLDKMREALGLAPMPTQQTIGFGQ